MMTYTMARGLKKGEPLDVKSLCQFTGDLKLDAVDWCGAYGHDPREIRRFRAQAGNRQRVRPASNHHSTGV